eukprot:COSAG04_NODE_187_length_21001_cov_8.855277_18_plen_114_part_00
MVMVWAGRVRSVRLQLTVDNLCSEDTLQILLNGESLEGERLERTHGMHHARMLGPSRTLRPIWGFQSRSFCLSPVSRHRVGYLNAKANKEGLGVQMPTTPPRARLPPAVPAWP